MQKRAVQFTKKPYLPLFSSETADKFAKDCAIKKSFSHALHLVTAHLQRQNQVAHALRTRDFWLASLSMHFPIHFDGARTQLLSLAVRKSRRASPRFSYCKRRKLWWRPGNQTLVMCFESGLPNYLHCSSDCQWLVTL